MATRLYDLMNCYAEQTLGSSRAWTQQGGHLNAPKINRMHGKAMNQISRTALRLSRLQRGRWF